MYAMNANDLLVYDAHAAIDSINNTFIVPWSRLKISNYDNVTTSYIVRHGSNNKFILFTSINGDIVGTLDVSRKEIDLYDSGVEDISKIWINTGGGPSDVRIISPQHFFDNKGDLKDDWTVRGETWWLLKDDSFSRAYTIRSDDENVYDAFNIPYQFNEVFSLHSDGLYWNGGRTPEKIQVLLQAKSEFPLQPKLPEPLKEVYRRASLVKRKALQERPDTFAFPDDYDFTNHITFEELKPGNDAVYIRSNNIIAYPHRVYHRNSMQSFLDSGLPLTDPVTRRPFIADNIRSVIIPPKKKQSDFLARLQDPGMRKPRRKPLRQTSLAPPNPSDYLWARMS